MEQKNDIGFAVRRLSNAIKRDIEKSKTDLNIEETKGVGGWAIKFLYENRSKDIFQRDFEEKFSIRPSTASKMLKTMEQKGLIERVSVDNDARLKKIVLTEKAVELHKKIVKDIKLREERLRKGLSEEEQKLFFAVTEKLIANLEDQND